MMNCHRKETVFSLSMGIILLPCLVTPLCAAPEQAQRAAAFVDSIGICTHWTYPDTPYGFAYTKVRDKLVESGIHHVRDGMNPHLQELGQLGIKTTLATDVDAGTPLQIKDAIKAANRDTLAIDAVEGPNEPDLFWVNFKKSYRGQGYEQGADGIIKGVIAFQKDLYAAIKGDPATKDIKVIGPALGKTYGYDTKSPLGKGTLTDYVDWGNFHPYPGGNPFSIPFAYDTIEKYIWHGNFPSGNLDEFPYAFDVYAPPFAPRPMAATETGYSTWAGGASEAAQAKYLPRLYGEYFRKGIQRAYVYEFVDEFEDKDKKNDQANFGLLRRDLTPKPAYTALKNMIGALAEKDVAATFKPGALDYTLQLTPPPGYDRMQYVHHLLLQKGNGEFYLLLWHEIADEDASVTPHRQLTVPPVPARLTLTTPIKSETLYIPGNDAPATALPIKNGQIELAIPDQVVILRLKP